MGTTIQMIKLVDGSTVSSAQSNGDYKFANFSAVLGIPSFSMSRAEGKATLQAKLPSGESVGSEIFVRGTTPVAISVSPEVDVSRLVFNVGEIDVGEALVFTDEPNGSPASPFATAAERDAAYPNPAPGTRVKMVNPAVGDRVVGGVLNLTNASWLEYRSSGKWSPPRGELIAGVYSSGDVPFFSGSSGILTLAELWTSAVIPDYMIPDGLWMMSLGFITISQASAPVAGAAFGMQLSGAFTIDNAMNFTIQGAAGVTPSINGSQTNMVKSVVPFMRSGAAFKGGPGVSGGSSTQGRAVTIGIFAANETRLRFGVLQSKVSDVGNIWNFEVVSQGMGS